MQVRLRRQRVAVTQRPCPGLGGPQLGAGATHAAVAECVPLLETPAAPRNSGALVSTGGTPHLWLADVVGKTSVSMMVPCASLHMPIIPACYSTLPQPPASPRLHKIVNGNSHFPAQYLLHWFEDNKVSAAI